MLRGFHRKEWLIALNELYSGGRFAGIECNPKGIVIQRTSKHHKHESTARTVAVKLTERIR